jgi:hypothetical protein
VLAIRIREFKYTLTKVIRRVPKFVHDLVPALDDNQPFELFQFRIKFAFHKPLYQGHIAAPERIRVHR